MTDTNDKRKHETECALCIIFQVLFSVHKSFLILDMSEVVEEDVSEDTVRSVKTATDLQRLKLEKLLKQPVSTSAYQYK